MSQNAFIRKRAANRDLILPIETKALIKSYFSVNYTVHFTPTSTSIPLQNQPIYDPYERYVQFDKPLQFVHPFASPAK